MTSNFIKYIYLYIIFCNYYVIVTLIFIGQYSDTKICIENTFIRTFFCYLFSFNTIFITKFVFLQQREVQNANIYNTATHLKQMK